MTTAHYGAVAVREPREEAAQANCQLLGQRLAEWVAVNIHGKTEEHPLGKMDQRMAP